MSVLAQAKSFGLGAILGMLLGATVLGALGSVLLIGALLLGAGLATFRVRRRGNRREGEREARSPGPPARPGH